MIVILYTVSRVCDKVESLEQNLNHSVSAIVISIIIGRDWGMTDKA